MTKRREVCGKGNHMNITLYGAASEKIDRIYMTRVEELGKALAEKGHALVFGAGSTGLMGAAARGFAAGNGKIVGVTPHFMHELEPICDFCTELIQTETMADRKDIMEEKADAFIIVPGGIGTFDEFFQILTLKALGRHSKPIILYNVPSRTGVNIEPETYAALADHPNIQAIKEASGDFSKLVKTVSLVGDKLDVYSGNDDQVVPMMALGAKGVISVLSNVIPAETVEMCQRFMNGDVKGSAAMQCKYLPLINALFSDVNPIPVKEAMGMLGYCTSEMREPLYPMDEAKKAVLRQKLIDAGLTVKN